MVSTDHALAQAPWRALLGPALAGLGKIALDLLFSAICAGDIYSVPCNSHQEGKVIGRLEVYTFVV